MISLRLPRTLAGGILRALLGFRHWDIWAVREPLRTYLMGISSLPVVLICWLAPQTSWQLQQLAVFVALLGCGIISIESTRTVKEVHGALSRDLQTVWYLAIATSFPPVFALAAPIPLMMYKLWRMPRMVVYRRVASNATLSLGYGAASYAFHAIPRSAAGPAPTVGWHVIAWTAVVALCGVIGWLINHLLLLGAIKLSDPGARVRELLGTRESITADLVELSLAVLVALLVAINPVLMALALPSVVLYRRYLMHAQLVAQARIDKKTGVLNAGAWQREAEAELVRAIRTGAPLALAVIGIDHFSTVTDTAGASAADQVLRDIASTLRSLFGGYDLIGRMGPEEFAVLLPRTGVREARRISERLRDHIAGEPVAIEDGSHAGFVFRLTVSIGIAVLDQGRRALDELVVAADTALSQAQKTGRNKVCLMIHAGGGPGEGDTGPL